MKNRSFILFVLVLSLLVFFSFVRALSSSTSGEFSLEPEKIYLNWTNNYQENLILNSSLEVIVVFDNSTLATANYSQGSGIELILKNNTSNLSNITLINGSAKFTVIAFIQDNMPGNYKGIFPVLNVTNSSENASVMVIIDLPINIDSSTGIGNFNGTLPSYATNYHSFYFDCSAVPNATSITANVTFDDGDLDLFLLSDGELVAKSINKNGNEERLSYSFIDQNATYELRIYGNHSSDINYNGTIALLALGSDVEEIDFETQNVTNNVSIRVFNLTNKGNVSIQDVEESFELYYLKKFESNKSANFTFFLPNSSVFEKIKIRLIWSGQGYYNFSIFNSSEELVGSSFEKHINADICSVEKEEFAEVNNTEKASFWRIEVINTSINYSNYELFVQAFVNSNKWISTNFSSYINKTFDIVGNENATKTIELNLTTPSDSISGRYEGLLIYSGNGGILKIPIGLDLNNRLNITIIEVKNEIVNVSFQQSSVNVSFLVSYVNGTKISPSNSPFDFTQNMSVWLHEPNASYSTKNLNFSNVSNETDWMINLTIPEKIPGGKYYIHINLTSDAYQGESLDDLTNKLLIVNDTGLNISLISYPSSLNKNSSGYVNVSVKNFGPIEAVNASIKLFICSNLLTASFYSSNCKYSSSGEEVKFNISAYNYTGCNIVWKITAGSENGYCTLWINGTSSSWFRNISFETEIYTPEVTTTTTIVPNITITTTTVSTTTTTITTTTTTTITQPAVNESIKVLLITPETPATFNVSQIDALKIQKITIVVRRNASNVVLRLKEGERPGGMPPPIKEEEGSVFKYLEISVINITDDDIASVWINFQVDKSWVSENGIDISTISLYRYFNNSWNKLSTEKVNETENHYHFKAISPGLSLFAIVGEKSKGFPIWKIFLIFGVIVAAILAFLFWPVEEKKPTAKPQKREDMEKVWEELKKKWEEIMKKKKSSS